MTKAEAVKNIKEFNRQQRKKELLNKEWYSLRSILGYSWAIFYFLLGGREAGKSYAVTDFYVRQFIKYERPFYWLRLSEASQRKLLMNNAEKLVDPDLRRKYNLDLVTNGENVYQVLRRDEDGKVREKKLMARVMCLSTFYNDKGSGLFDKDFLNDPKMFYNICLDEMNRELNERKTFDIVYAFTNQLENLVRSTKQRLRVICIGNTLEEASDILSNFNFLPEEFGRYKLHKKRAVIEYIEPSEKYKARRKGTVADILMPDASTFTNEIKMDNTLITKQRLLRPTYVIKFTKSKSDWFTVWDNSVITKYNGEKVPIVPMRPYLDEIYNLERVNTIIQLFDTRSYLFRNLLTQKQYKNLYIFFFFYFHVNKIALLFL